MSAAYIQVHPRLDGFMVNPNHTVHLGPYCLQYRLPKTIIAYEKADDTIVTGWKMAIHQCSEK